MKSILNTDTWYDSYDCIYVYRDIGLDIYRISRESEKDFYKKSGSIGMWRVKEYKY